MNDMKTFTWGFRSRRWMSACAVAVLSVSLVLAHDTSEAARRMGGGKSLGMQRSAPTQAAPASTPPSQAAQPAQQATPPQQAPAAQPAAAAAATGAAGAAAKSGARSWLGPIAGLAAGLGLAALMSHLGMGEAFANAIMMVLLLVVAFVVIRWLMARMSGGGRRSTMEPALATAGGAPSVEPTAAPQPQTHQSSPMSFTGDRGGEATSVTGRPLRQFGDASSVAAAAPVASAIPAGFDQDAFAQMARALFIRMQAAYDAADLEDLRRYTTPEVFGQLRLDLQDRGAVAGQTDVQRVSAQLLGVVEEDRQQIVSVRFEGLIAESVGAPAEAFDEVWHLVKPVDRESGWAIAGIQQQA